MSGAPQLRGLDELPSLPFTTEHALRRESLQLLTVSQGEVARVVTLRTSGTTGAPKRLYFSADDLACTIDFFEHGMATLVGPGQRVLILLPGELPDSVGDLLRKGLARLGVTGIVYGPVCEPAAVIQLIHDQRIDSLVGIPAHVLSLARHASGRRLGPARSAGPAEHRLCAWRHRRCGPTRMGLRSIPTLRHD